MPQALGIDCGGSTTRAVLVSDGRAVWSGAGGPGNVASLPPEIYRASIESAVAGCPVPDAICSAFAGLVTEHQREDVVVFLSELFPHSLVKAVPDFEAALVACEPDAQLCVLAGTGSLVCSRGSNGVVHKSGGKGYLLGDEGSAYQYGRDALLYFLDAPKDDVSSELEQGILLSFGSLKKSEIIERLYLAPDAPRLVASLFEVFCKDAENRAIYALKSLRIQTSKLAHIVSQHLRQYHPELRRVHIGCQGGVWSTQLLRDAFTEQLAFWCKVDELEVDYDPPAPVFGAAELAERMLL